MYKKLHPQLVGIVRAAGQRMAHALVAHYYVHLYVVACPQDRQRAIRAVRTPVHPDPEDVNERNAFGQIFLGLGQLRRVLVDERDRRIGRSKPVAAYEPAVVPHIARRFKRHMAGNAIRWRLGKIERPDDVAADAAVVPVVVFVLPALPAIAVHFRGNAHFVARAAKFGCFVDRLQHGLAVRFGFGPHQHIMHPPAQPLFGARKRILVRRSDRIAAIAPHIA